MSATILSGLTAVTTITLFEDYSLVDIIEDVKKAIGWLNSLLPDNKLVKVFVYSTGSLCLLRCVPLLLRHTDFFKYYDKEIQYFHRSSNNSQILRMKNELLSELKDGNANLPLYEDKLIILELNIGGGTNLSFYPEGACLIATDVLEDSKEKLDNNFLITNDRIVLNQYIQTSPEELHSVPDETISCVVCFHSLCSVRNCRRSLLEMKRVLLPGGKVYFIEHTLETKRFSLLWFAQKNFRINMFLLGCSLQKVEDCFEDVGFSELQYKKEILDRKYFFGPMWSLAPHVYGFARK